MPTKKLVKRKEIFAENPRAECREMVKPTQGQTLLLAMRDLQLVLTPVRLSRSLDLLAKPPRIRWQFIAGPDELFQVLDAEDSNGGDADSG